MNFVTTAWKKGALAKPAALNRTGDEEQKREMGTWWSSLLVGAES